MLDESQLSSHNDALVALAPLDSDWEPILQASNQVVLYNPTSHALSICKYSSDEEVAHPSSCPYCHRPLPSDFDDLDTGDVAEINSSHQSHTGFHSRAPNYFQLLAIANETSSRPSSPPPLMDGDTAGRRRSAFPREAMAEGYFKAFFQEECRLGMGAYGSVYLCQHVLDGNPLGHFAVKKIAVGESHSYLLTILKEVRLLERLHHRNIITYHHTWLETCQFSAFGPKVPALHVLMQWAEGGSLDDFIDLRLGRSTNLPHIHNSDSHSESLPSSPPSDIHSAAARIRAFRAMKRAPPEERERIRREMASEIGAGSVEGRGRTSLKAVHLLSPEEVKSLFSDVIEGLAFLHNQSILHLDLKPGNVLLTWDQGKLIPRAMLSDFGTSRDMLQSNRNRSGNTGTLEYSSPESLPSPHTGLLQQVDSKADMWSLGMILHKLIFFKLPYQYATDGEASTVDDRDRMSKLENEVFTYSGFRPTQLLVTSFESRRLPRAFLLLLESLLNIAPSSRPSCDRVLSAIREGRLDPVTPAPNLTSGSLIPVVRNLSGDRPRSRSPAHYREALASDRHSPAGSEGTAEKRQHEQQGGDKTSLLRLGPPPSSVPVPGPTKLQGRLESMWVQWGGAIEVNVWRLQPNRATLVRGVKSCILAAKAVSVSWLVPTMMRSYPQTVGVLLVLGVIDTLYEGLGVSVILAAVHAVVIWRFRADIYA